jgi:ppGpp synthetase/RelA/SpoT-type nucleotidyltranferase
MNPLIESFVTDYEREFDFYQEVARLCAHQCEEMLLVNGIRGMVTYRAKRPDRLQEKLINRETKRVDGGGVAYGSHEGMRSDIADFSGVRIALYFPADRSRIATLIDEEFGVQERREFPDPAEVRPVDKRFDGYHATHHRVVLLAEADDSQRSRYVGSLVEIQVASVLMHAWSEVEHDLTYKPLSGELSDEESAILDQINGLVLTGEIALEQLQKAVEKRVAKADVTFSNRYELSAFLFETWQRTFPKGDAEPAMGDVGALLWLLRKSELDRADRIRPLIETLDADTATRPIADQVADLVLAEHPESTEEYRLRGFGSTASASSNADGRGAIDAATVGEFLTRWHVVERFGRLLWEVRGSGIRPRIMISYNDVAKLVGNDLPTLERLRWIWNVRNRIVHGRRGTRQVDAEEAANELEGVIASLNDSPDEEVKVAMQRALAGDDASFAVRK